MKIHWIITDCSMLGAKAILDIVAPSLREEERREAFNMFFEAIKATLESYEEKADRMRRRVKPSAN